MTTEASLDSMFRILLTDPGMHDKTVEVKTLAKVQEELDKEGQRRNYTRATVSKDGVRIANYIRFVGTSAWMGN